MHRPFRFGVTTGGRASHGAWVELARKVEELGYATLLMPDRPSFVSLAPLTALAVAAATTTSLRVGSYVFCNDFRHPALLAQELASLDVLSEGRFELGIGAGVGPSDYQQMGMPFESVGTRIGRVEEAITVIKQFWTEGTVNFSGKYYTITGMKGQPKPVQQPRPPIFVGSSGKRMLSFAAREADIIAITFKWTAQGIDPADATMEQKLAWVQAAAGERFSQLEFAQTRFDIVVTDSAADVTAQTMMPLPKKRMSIEQTVTHLQEQRERYGISYIQVYEGQVENFAPVVALLAGK